MAQNNPISLLHYPSLLGPGVYGRFLEFKDHLFFPAEAFEVFAEAARQRVTVGLKEGQIMVKIDGMAKYIFNYESHQVNRWPEKLYQVIKFFAYNPDKRWTDLPEEVRNA